MNPYFALPMYWWHGRTVYILLLVLHWRTNALAEVSLIAVCYYSCYTLQLYSSFYFDPESDINWNPNLKSCGCHIRANYSLLTQSSWLSTQFFQPLPSFWIWAPCPTFILLWYLLWYSFLPKATLGPPTTVGLPGVVWCSNWHSLERQHLAGWDEMDSLSCSNRQLHDQLSPTKMV